MSSDYVLSVVRIFGLSRPVNKIVNTSEIYGVIPYIATELLRGKSYTKAADIWIIMREFTSGILAFNNRFHDFNLSLDDWDQKLLKVHCQYI
jgi:serine/threonine protein kinase